MDFTGLNILVNGSTRGIGRAIAESFLATGGRVIGTYASNSAATYEFIESGNWSDLLQLHKCDVSDSLAVEKASDITGSVLDINGGL